MRGRAIWAALAIFVLTAVVYIPAMQGGYGFDDSGFLYQNPLIRASDGLRRFWLTTEATDYFPLVSSCLWVQWRLWGDHPAGYHVVNIILHGVNAVLVWRVLAGLRIPGAWLAGVLFGVHPVNVETAAWITQHKNTVPMVFYLLAILSYVRFEDTRRGKWYALSLAGFLLALVSKTSVVMLPFVLIGCSWWRRGRITRGTVLRSIPFFALSLALGLVTVWFQYNRSIAEDVVRTDSFLSRLAVAGCAVWFYLYKAVLPVNLCFVYPRWQIDTHSVISYVPALAVAACLAVFWWRRRGWGRAPFAAFGYYVVNLLPVLGFLNIYYMRFSFVADHWQYTSIVSVIAFLCGGGTYLAAQVRPRLRRPATVLAVAVTAALAVCTSRYAWILASQERMWRDTLAKNPEAFLAHNNLGMLLGMQGRFDEAIRHFDAALRISPDYALAHFNWAKAMAAQNRPEEAIRHFAEGLAVEPHNQQARRSYGRILLDLGRPQPAAEQFRAILDRDPANPDARTAMAEAQYQVGTQRISEGRVRDAIAAFREAMRLGPQWPPASALAWIYATSADPGIRNADEAIRLAQLACEETKYSNALLLDTLAAAYAEGGRFPEAISTGEKAFETARRAGNSGLCDEIGRRIDLYRNGQPYREGRVSAQ